jgi:hypothetical protein
VPVMSDDEDYHYSDGGDEEDYDYSDDDGGGGASAVEAPSESKVTHTSVVGDCRPSHPCLGAGVAASAPSTGPRHSCVWRRGCQPACCTAVLPRPLRLSECVCTC